MTTAITLLNINIALGCIALALNLFVLVYLVVITRPRKARRKGGKHG